MPEMPRRPGAEGMSEASSVYLRMKELFTGTPVRGRRSRRREEQPGGSQPFSSGRDPKGLGDVVDALASQLGWTPQLAQSDLLEGWRELAGEETAKHAIPDAITDGVLVVRCESTAWATQLRMVQAQLLAKIAAAVGDGVVTSLRIVGPVAPSWRKGRYHIAGRGPRDTYG